LTDFIVAGDLARHLRRMRAVYAERRAGLIDALATELDDELEVVGSMSGFEVVGLLRRAGISDLAINQLAKVAKIELMPLSRYAIEPLERGGLLLGFAAVSLPRSLRAIPALRDIVRSAAAR
jgi:GntR family transcriptional regulator/MocR family aminotransferase